MRLAKTVLVFLIFVQPLFAINPIVLKSDMQKNLIGNNVEFLLDESNKLSINEVVALNSFKPSNELVPNFRLTKAAVWLHFKVPANLDSGQYLLELQNPICNEAHLYSLEANGKYASTLLGVNKPYKYRKYDYPNFLFDLENNTNFEKDYYLKVSTNEQCQIPLYVGTARAVVKSNDFSQMLVAIFLTIAAVMFMYNFFIYASVKDKSYLYYVFYILSIAMAQITLKGFGFKLLWPNNVWLQQHSTYLFSCLAGVAVMVFFRQFIGKNNFSKFINLLINTIIVGYCICFIVSIFNLYTIAYFLLQVLAITAVLLCLGASILAVRKKVASANYFLYAWLIFILGVVLFVAKDFNWLDYSDFTTNTMPIGVALELILLSFALANRIKKLQIDKEASQKEALEKSLENAQIIKNKNADLESKVKARTIELETAMSDLKRSEVELVNREKMSSLGVLTAGIAHEINNPINFVTASIAPLKRDIKDILSLLETYANIKDKPDVVSQLDKAATYAQDIDAPYLVEEISLLLDGIEEGAIRTAGIVKGLQKFSRSDEHIFRNSDVKDGIENTLTLLNSQIKDKITIIREYEDVEPLYCSIGKLNQVFLNLISNAIYAVVNDNKPTKTITLSVVKINTEMHISIIDNGIGMTEETKKKIFDPFFTTKEVGQGTGLGMAISIGIIQDHQGQIIVNSKVGEGTNVTLVIPMVELFPEENADFGATEAIKNPF